MLQIEFKQGNYRYVVENGEELIRRASPRQWAELSRVMAEAWFRLGEYSKPLDYLDAFVQAGGEMGRDENYLYGFSLYRTARYDDAAEYLRKACGADDALTQNASYHLADCYLRGGTLSALLKGGIAKKEGKLTGKMIIEEVQDPEKKVITEIASDNWETYSMDYTTSAECNQIRVSFTVGRGGWGNDIGAVRVDNAKLTGTSRTYSPKFGFIDNTADVEYFTIDESGAYAPAQPKITINIED